MEERNGRWAGRIMSRGLRWDRTLLFCPWIIEFRIPPSCRSTMSRSRGLLCLIFVTRVEPSWVSLSFSLGRHALLCSKSRLTYRGRRRQMRIALFWIRCNTSRDESEQCTMQTALYSKRDLMNTLYNLIKIFGSVPPHASILRILSLFSARRDKSWIWVLKLRECYFLTRKFFPCCLSSR